MFYSMYYNKLMIKQAQVNDLITISKMYVDANPSCDQEIILKWTKEGFQKYSKYYFIYTLDRKIVGSISGVLKTKNVGIVNDLAISQKYRNKKMGTKLMKHLLGKFKQDDLKKVILCVCWQNASAIPFYYRLGFKFKKIGQEDGEDVVFLEKELI